MKTLIFANTKFNKGRNRGYYTAEFIQEGDITDAISYFDGSRHFGSFFRNDEEGYWFANNDNGPLITDEEIDKGNGEHNVTVYVHAFWTKNIDNLEAEDIIAMIDGCAGHYLVEEAIEANGYDVDSFLLAKYFDDLEHFLNDRPEDYISRNYTAHDEKPEDEKNFELNGKFYTQF